MTGSGEAPDDGRRGEVDGRRGEVDGRRGDGASTGTPFFDRPLTSLHLLLVTTALLLALGLVMVLSASMVESYQQTGSTYAVFSRQLVWVAVGLVAFWLGVRLPPRAHRLLAYPALLASAVLLVAVLLPGIGLSLNGAQRWLGLGPLQVQPSELAKVALALWGADLLVRKQRLLGRARHLVMPLVPVGALVAALVVLEPDLGTSLCLAMVLFGLLWTVGAPTRILGALIMLATAAVTVLAVVEPYRFARIAHFLNPSADPSGSGFQPLLGLSSLSSGGWFGVGLGQGRAKWVGLPEGHTDYIFAVLGEELGLVGALVVLLLYATLAYAGFRVARRTADPFVRLTAAAVTVWLTGQALVNMGYVSGLLPVTGVPLPLISAGGTSLLVTVFALGMLASFARYEPDAAAQLAQRGRVARLLWMPAPRLPRERPGRRVDRSGERAGSRASAPARRAAGSGRPSQTSPRREARRR
jgi:cell division protein FtsW